MGKYCHDESAIKKAQKFWAFIATVMAGLLAVSMHTVIYPKL